MRRPWLRVPGCLLVVCPIVGLLCAPAARAQSAPGASASQPPASSGSASRHEAEQNLITLPATQPLRRFAHHFRITRRFARDLTLGSGGDMASDPFGLDNGSPIGLDYRFAPRVAGHSPPGRGARAVAVEQTPGHLFQISLTNSFGTTYGQTALGRERSNVYPGFNLARKS
jgi:hypothetical protein